RCSTSWPRRNIPAGWCRRRSRIRASRIPPPMPSWAARIWRPCAARPSSSWRREARMTRKLRIGLIGSGFIARCHVYGYRTMLSVFPEAAAQPELELVADMTDDLAKAAAEKFGFRRATGDWRKLVADPAVDIVDICVPSHLHKEMALAAIAAGKHVYCEKPVGLNGGEASEIAAAAARAGVKSLVGYSYLRNPLIAFARKLIQEGAIGEVTHFRGAHNEDYMADPAAPFVWRCDSAIAGKAGAL